MSVLVLLWWCLLLFGTVVSVVLLWWCLLLFGTVVSVVVWYSGVGCYGGVGCCLVQWCVLFDTVVSVVMVVSVVVWYSGVGFVMVVSVLFGTVVCVVVWYSGVCCCFATVVPVVVSLQWCLLLACYSGACCPFVTVGKTANCCIVMARLITKGHDHGMHPFLLQIRDLDTHQPLAGQLLDLSSCRSV